MKYVLGVDLGTTAIKVGLFNNKGIKVVTHTQEYSLITPTQSVVEQAPEVYWEAFTVCVKKVLEKSMVDPEDILSLSISSQGETIAFLDKNMEPMANFIVWMDTRSHEEAEIINDWFTSEEILKVTGQGPITSIYPACKILWMKNHHPEIFEKTAKILLLEDYFFYRLGGVFCGEGSLWCTSYMWDITIKGWWTQMLKRLDVSEQQLPQIIETTNPIGRILPEIALELGLSPKLELVMGGLDQVCGAIGVGNVRPGVLSECTGAALVVATMTEDVVFDYDGELPCFYGAIPDLYMLHAGAKGGIIFRWLRDTLCLEELAAEKRGLKSAYKQMDEQAERITAGSDGLIVLPFWGGAGAPDTDQYARGMIYGLGFEHTKAHLIRSFMESTAINIKRMVEYIETITGKSVTEVRSLGGGSMSPIWCQIKADALGLPVITMKNTQEAACLGAAIIAGVGIGIWPSIGEIASSVTEADKVYTPNPKNRNAYENLAYKYNLLTDSIKDITKEL